MKFSDMMGKGSKTEVDDADTITETETLAARLNAPPVPEAPVRFGGNRSETPKVEEPEASPPALDAPALDIPAVETPAPGPGVYSIDRQPSMADVMSELVPRPTRPGSAVAAGSVATGVTTRTNEQADVTLNGATAGVRAAASEVVF